MEAFREWLRPEVVWMFIGVALLLLEFMLPGLIVFFFGLGAILVAVLCLVFEPSLNVQIVIFLVSSVLLLLSLRRWVRRVFTGHASGGEEDEGVIKYQYAGERATVIETITPERDGRVEFHGARWAAEADQRIEEGARVEIVSQNNITLKVKPL